MYAVTRPLSELISADGATPDLNDVAGSDGFLFVRDGVGIAGRGIAARVPIDAAVRWLAAINHRSTVDGVTPRAIGSLPFRPGDDGDLVVPAVLVGKRADGTQWVTTFDDSYPTEALSAPDKPTPTATTYSICHSAPIDTYLAAVAAARDAVRAGQLTKAVIARPITVTADQPIDVAAVLRRLKASFGSCYRYSIYGLIGASPELLVEVYGAVVRSHPLAGTTPRTGDPTNDAALASALQASTKNRIEHRIVIDEVHGTLLPWASYLDWEPEPSIV